MTSEKEIQVRRKFANLCLVCGQCNGVMAIREDQSDRETNREAPSPSALLTAFRIRPNDAHEFSTNGARGILYESALLREMLYSGCITKLSIALRTGEF